MGDAHRKVSLRAARRPTFNGESAVVLRLAEPSNTGGVRLVLGHDLDATQLERAGDPLPEHEFHAAMLLPAL